MFESLLERLLLARLGNYIAGLEKEKLKVALWRGDITLENVYLKPEVLLMFQLPLILKFGKIKKLVIKVPWTRLNSSPVEIILEQLYVVVVPQHRSDWSYSEAGDILRRKDHIEACYARTEAHHHSSQDRSKQKSFMERLATRVLDNLQVTIKDIHVRFEQAEGRRFSAGVRLQTLTCHTTNSEWTQEFTDRTVDENAQEIYKVCRVHGLAVYWVCEDPITLADCEEAETLHQMQQEVNEDDCILVPTSVTAKLIHRTDHEGYERPVYSLSVEIPELSLKYRQQQFHDCVKLFEYFTRYSRFLLKAENFKKFRLFSPAEKTPAKLWKFAGWAVRRTIKQRKDRSFDYFKPPATLLQTFEKEFKMLLRKTKKGTSLSEIEQANYDGIILLIPTINLLRWTKHVALVVCNEDSQPAQSSWFRFWSSAKTQVEESYEALFAQAARGSIAPKSFVWLEFTFRLAEGVLVLSKATDGSVDQTTELVWSFSQISYDLNKRTIGSDSIFTLQSLDGLYLEGKEEVVVCRKLLTAEDTPLCRVDMRFSPFELDCSAYIAVNSQPMEYFYSSTIVSNLISFFVVPHVEEVAKVAAWDTVQVVQDSTQETLVDLLYGDSKYLVSVNVCGPCIYVNLPTQEGQFMLNLGRLSLSNFGEAPDNEHQQLSLEISELGLTLLSPSTSFAVVDNFGVSTTLSFLKGKHRRQKWKDPKSEAALLPDLHFTAQMPSFKMNVTPSVYQQLLKLHETLELNESSWASISLDKAGVLAQAKITGTLKKQGTNVQNWMNYFTALSGSYLYFYLDKGAQDAATFFYIKDCSLVETSSDTFFGLRLENRHGECVICFTTAEELQAWSRALTEQIEELQSYASAAKTELSAAFASHHWLHFSFTAPSSALVLSNEEYTPLCEFTCTGLSTDILCRAFDCSLESSLAELTIKDNVQKSSEHFTTVIKSTDNLPMLRLNLKYIGKKSPDYSDQDILAVADLGSIEVNWNPSQLATIILFFQAAGYSPEEVPASVGVICPEHVLVNLQFSLRSLTLYCIISENDFMLGKACLIQTEASVLVKNGGYEVNLTFKDIEVYDLTNYPKTTVTHSIQPFKLFSAKDNSDSLLKVSILSYSEDNPNKPEELGSILTVHMSSIDIVYLHQPVMRIIDFFNYKILGVTDFHTLVKDASKRSPLPQLSAMFSGSDIWAPPSEIRRFTSITVFLDNPTVILTPRPHYRSNFTINLGRIKVTNFPSVTRNRHSVEAVWLDVFDVTLTDACIMCGDHRVTEDFDLKLQIERPVLKPSQILRNEVDASYLISGSLEQIQFNVRQSDFRVLMQISDLNLAYDDKLDRLICSAPPEVPVQDPNHGGVFIACKLTLNSISLLLLHEETALAEFLFGGSMLSVVKYNDGSMDLKLESLNLLGLISKEVSGVPDFPGKVLDEMFSIPEDCTDSLYHYKAGARRLTHVLFSPLEEQDSHNYVFTLDLNNSWEGNKDIMIQFTQFRINFQMAVFLQLQNFFYYGFPDYTGEVDTPYDYLCTNLAILGNQAAYSAPRISVNTSFMQPLMLFPGLSASRVFVAQSDLSFTYFREKEALISQQLTPAGIKRLIAHELEVFTSRLEDLTTLARFQQTKKRKLSDPAKFMYESTEIRSTMFDSLFNIMFDAGHFKLILTHKDLVLANNAYQCQQKMLAKGQPVTDALNLELQQSETPRPSEESSSFGTGSRLQDDASVSSSFHAPAVQPPRTASTYNLKGLNILLVNDASGAYAPVLELTIGEMSALAIQEDPLWSLSTKIAMSINFYNPIVNHWEPLLELFILEIEAATSAENNPRSSLTIRIDPDLPLNIGISEVMIMYFSKVLDSWNQTDDVSIAVSAKDLASPFTIYNNTGHTILVEKPSRSAVQSMPNVMRVVPGDTVDYQIDLTSMRATELNFEQVNLFLILGEERTQPICNVPVNKVQVLHYTIPHAGEQVPVLVEVKLMDTRKLIIVSSVVEFHNTTDCTVSVKSFKQRYSDSRVCAPGQRVPIPVLFFNGMVGFGPVDARETEIPYFSVENDFFNKKKSFAQVRVGNVYLVALYKRKAKRVGKTVVELKSPVTFVNRMPCDVRLALGYEEIGRHTDVLIKAGEELQDRLTGLQTKLSVCLSIAGFAPSDRQVFISKRVTPPKKVSLMDERNSTLHVQIFSSKVAGWKIVFYPAIILINNTEANLSFFYKGASTYSAVPGQTVWRNVLSCNPTKRLIVGINSARSKKLKLEAIGAPALVQFSSRLGEQEALYEFIYDTQVTQVVSSELLYNKVVKVSPRFIVTNETQQLLHLKQAAAGAVEMQLVPNSSRPFHWSVSGEQERMVAARVDGSWLWSGGFFIANLGTFSIQCQHDTHQTMYTLLKVDIKLIGSSVIVGFLEENERQPAYRIVNNSERLALQVYQSGLTQEARWIDQLSDTAFAWTQPQSQHLLSVKFFIGSEFTGQKNKFNLDKINQSYKIKMRRESGNLTVYARVYNEGPTKILEFADSRSTKVRTEPELIYTRCALDIPKFGVSVIEYYEATACELLYFSITNIKGIAQELKRVWQAELVFESVQIDNQIAHMPIYPVLLCPDPYVPQDVLQISFSLYTNTGTNCLNFEFCEILLQTLWLKLESSIVRKLLGFVGRLFLENRPVYSSTEVVEMYRQPTWQTSPIITSDRSYYFGTLKLCPIKIIVSFLPTKGQEGEETVDSFASIANALGTAIIALDSAPIKLCTVEMTDLSGVQRQIIAALWMHYKSQLSTEILSLVGHAVVLGNPVGLFRNLGTGVFDFFYEPAHGMIKGPVSAGKGFVKGTASLVSNTVQGTFGTFSKLASSLATGLTTLTQNREYNTNRQRDFAINKPKNLVDGLGMGFKALFSNLGKGITGIITEPIRGYKRKKMKGLFLGGATGLTGLLVKPIAGVLDAASRTADGIKNTTGSQDIAETPRQRPPRCFYGHYGLFKPYNEYDALVYQFISKLKKGMYVREKFWGQCVSKDIRGQVWVFAIFMRVVLICDVRTTKIIWVVDTDSILRFDVIEHGVLLITKPSQHKATKNKTEFLIPFKDLACKEYIVKKVKQLLEASKQ